MKHRLNDALYKFLPAIWTGVALAILWQLEQVLPICKLVAMQDSTAPADAFERLKFIVPVGMMAGLIATLGGNLSWRAMAGAAGTLLAIAISFAPARWQALSMAVPVLLPVGLIATGRREGKVFRSVLQFSLLSFVISSAAMVRVQLLQSYLPTPLDPDSVGYRQIAMEGSGYNTLFREPGFIWAIQLAKTICRGDYSETAVRLYGVIFSLFSIGIVFLLVQRYFGLLAATTAGLLYGLNYELSCAACRLLREDLIIASFFAYVSCYIAIWRKPFNWPKHLLLGLTAAALLLLRLNSLYFLGASLLLLLAVAAYDLRRTPSRLPLLATSLMIICVLVAPHIRHNLRTYGTALNNHDARYYANQELSGIDPRVPSKEEFAKSAFVGTPLSIREYLFDYHTPRQLATGMIRGFGRLFTGSMAAHAYKIVPGQIVLYPFLILYFVGAVLLVITTAGRILLGLTLLLYAPSFYLVQFSWFDPRLLTIAFVCFYVCSGAALHTAFSKLRQMNPHRLLEKGNVR